jgi:aminopeptidase N
MPLKQYGIDFPLPKCDFVAIPDSYGAMENWGLILFQDIFLLYDDENPDSLNKQRVAEVVGIKF